MANNLVIAEKPSVAQSIAKVLGCTDKQDGYLSGGGYLVSWCVGHLVELAEPETYDSKYETWKKEDLPIIPDVFQYQVTAATRKQFKVLKDLLHRDDVDCVTNACDAGREGELIFRLVYDEMKRSVMALQASRTEGNMTDFTKQHSAENVPTGSLASMPPGSFLLCMVRLSMWAV